MSYETLIYIILAGIIALFIALFQYKFKSKIRYKLSAVFIFLRFVTFFSVFLLLINPKFEQLIVFEEKPNLVIAIDNSSSIKHLKYDKEVLELIESLKNNSELADKFNIDYYTFGKSLNNSDSITFSESETNIDNTFTQLAQIYKNTISPTILISDGNQTYGNDYQFVSQSYDQPIYPVITGDTITYVDLKIQQLNVNRYAYLKNEFPVEAILVYNGHQTIHTNFDIYAGANKVFSKTVRFTKDDNSEIINVVLPADKVGIATYKAILAPIVTEKNTINNTKNFAIEIIDQKTNIALVSDLLHPDLGMFKKSIESNEQRAVSLLKPNEVINHVNDFQLFILYQPNNTFKNVIELLNKLNANRLMVVGTKTDLNFLNTISENYQYEITNQTEDFQGKQNFNYKPFTIDELNFESFPPLKSNYGSVTFASSFETLLNKKINNVTTESPLLATFEIQGRKEGVLLGENIWKWRAQSFLNNESFNEFDNFISKLIQYLASNKQRSRLNVDFESFYDGNQNVVINAQVFDKNYEFDTRENLTIKIKDLISNEEKSFSFVFKNNNTYQVDLSNLPASQYSFTVKADYGNISKSGTFQILEYDVEQQFLNAHVTKLQQLATNQGATSFFIANTESLATHLLADVRYKPIQKSHKNSIPLIDWNYLLFLIALSLSIEWFLRKFNGLT
ncbi:hypothetical protein APS56_02000 [Pseudalgibacter alginicilyticus]|uniref:VWA domain-containing protein n=1 Tax=Pseudalgibacter alginicilyticus TaxID=1736674 RepID=A0A0P0D056_9FLAO|nr:hypothetical protein [Pseudalgibacter alginicilyticus]ALJ03999.1 hypothetical protein APS56_02000 [Pseudalgibacter alginicilyticus]